MKVGRYISRPAGLLGFEESRHPVNSFAAFRIARRRGAASAHILTVGIHRRTLPSMKRRIRLRLRRFCRLRAWRGFDALGVRPSGLVHFFRERIMPLQLDEMIEREHAKSEPNRRRGESADFEKP